MRYVYFIKPVGMDGPVKIGTSNKPRSRLAQIAAWSPFHLEIAAMIDGGLELERRLHARFAHLHHHLEWFNASPEIDEVIEAINRGDFDASALPEPIIIRTGRTPPRPEWFRRQMSYSTRVWNTEKRTGTRCPVSLTDMCRNNDVERIAAVDAYLADPTSFPKPAQSILLATPKCAETDRGGVLPQGNVSRHAAPAFSEIFRQSHRRFFA